MAAAIGHGSCSSNDVPKRGTQLKGPTVYRLPGGETVYVPDPPR